MADYEASLMDEVRDDDLAKYRDSDFHKNVNQVKNSFFPSGFRFFTKNFLEGYFSSRIKMATKPNTDANLIIPENKESIISPKEISDSNIKGSKVNTKSRFMDKDVENSQISKKISLHPSDKKNSSEPLTPNSKSALNKSRDSFNVNNEVRIPNRLELLRKSSYNDSAFDDSMSKFSQRSLSIAPSCMSMNSIMVYSKAGVISYLDIDAPSINNSISSPMRSSFHSHVGHNSGNKSPQAYNDADILSYDSSNSNYIEKSNSKKNIEIFNHDNFNNNNAKCKINTKLGSVHDKLGQDKKKQSLFDSPLVNGKNNNLNINNHRKGSLNDKMLNSMFDKQLEIPKMNYSNTDLAQSNPPFKINRRSKEDSIGQNQAAMGLNCPLSMSSDKTENMFYTKKKEFTMNPKFSLVEQLKQKKADKNLESRKAKSKFANG